MAEGISNFVDVINQGILDGKIIHDSSGWRSKILTKDFLRRSESERVENATFLTLNREERIKN